MCLCTSEFWTVFLWPGCLSLCPYCFDFCYFVVLKAEAVSPLTLAFFENVLAIWRPSQFHTNWRTSFAVLPKASRTVRGTALTLRALWVVWHLNTVESSGPPTQAFFLSFPSFNISFGNVHRVIFRMSLSLLCWNCFPDRLSFWVLF